MIRAVMTYPLFTYPQGKSLLPQDVKTTPRFQRSYGFLEFRKIYLPVFILRRRFVARNKRNNFGSPSHRNFHPGR